MKEEIKIYKKENGKIIEKTIEVSLVPDYSNMGWTTEKPKKDEEPILKKNIKKENTK